MTAHVSNLIDADVPARSDIDFTTVVAKFELAAALALNDTIDLMKIPMGATMIDVIVSVPDLDTGTAIVFSVGDEDDPDRFILISTAGQAGGIARLTNPVGLGHRYIEETILQLKITTGPTTGATSGTIRAAAIYTLQNDDAVEA